MKKLLFALICLCFISSASAKESTITYKHITGVYYNQKIDGVLSTGQANIFDLDGRVAYCIEPGLDITTNIYDTSDSWNVVNLPENTKKYLELVGFYGYEYPGHQNTRYYLAAQELIWKAAHPGITIIWTTGRGLGGDTIDVRAERDEILKLVSDHEKLPSFAYDTIKGTAGEKVVLEDTNNVLGNFEPLVSSNHKITISGNKMEIEFGEASEETLSLRHKHYDSLPLVIYTKGNSQKLASLRIYSEEDYSVNILCEDAPLVIDVPDTNMDFDYSICICGVLMGFGLLLRAKKC